MRILFWPMSVAVALATLHPARADDLTAIRPGVMCISADALAKLTLPDGSSRSAAPRPRPEDLRTKAEGGCIDIPQRARVTVLQGHRLTSSVAFDPGDGGGRRTFTAPNVDFVPAEAAPVQGAANAGTATVLATSTRLGISVVADAPDWCVRQPQLRVVAQDPRTLGSPELDALLQQFGVAFLAARCPAAQNVRYADTAAGRPAGWQATASAADRWAPRQAVAAASPTLNLDNPAPVQSGAPVVGMPLPRASAAAQAVDAAVPSIFVQSPVPAPTRFTVSACPNDYPGSPQSRSPLVCSCDPASLDTGAVFGTDFYSFASVPCRAARHAGVLAETGGPAVFLPVLGARNLTGRDRNGVDSGAENAAESFQVRQATPDVVEYARNLILRDRDPAASIAIRAPDGRLLTAQLLPPPALPDFTTAIPAPGVSTDLPSANAVSLPISPPFLGSGSQAIGTP